MARRNIAMGNISSEMADRMDWVERQFSVAKEGVVCLDCGKTASEGEYSCGECSECGGTIGSECS